MKNIKCNFDQGSSSDSAASGSDDPEDEALTHVVVFKCIGSNRDKRSQVVWKEVSAKLEHGEVVQVKIKPEPQNPFDASICLLY